MESTLFLSYIVAHKADVLKFDVEIDLALQLMRISSYLRDKMMLNLS